MTKYEKFVKAKTLLDVGYLILVRKYNFLASRGSDGTRTSNSSITFANGKSDHSRITVHSFLLIVILFLLINFYLQTLLFDPSLLRGERPKRNPAGGLRYCAS